MKPAFLVDGLTEKRFIESNCKGSHVRITGLNGKTVTATAIAERIATQIRLWKGRHYPIIILVDREKRVESSEAFANAIEESLREAGIDDQIIVGVADRMIENWMCADDQLWPGVELPDDVDGISGLSLIKKLRPTYGKAANGPGILSNTRASEIKKKSKSFRDLADKLTGLKCNWLAR